MKTFLRAFALLFCVASFAQTTVKGTVSDDSGMPLAGANIIIAGTSTGVVADFDGIKKVYQDSSCIKFKIDPNQDCYLTIFYITDDETQILYPIPADEIRDDRSHNRLFKKGETVPIDWICTALKGKNIEEGSLICVMTKQDIPFYERKKEHELSTQTSRDNFLKWLSVIERDKKNLKEFAITIIPKD